MTTHTHAPLMSLKDARAYSILRASPSWSEGVNAARLADLDAQALCWHLWALFQQFPDIRGLSLIERGHACVEDALCIHAGADQFFVPTARGDNPEAARLAASVWRVYAARQPDAFERALEIRHFGRHVFEGWAAQIQADPETGRAWAIACRETLLSVALSAVPEHRPRHRM